MKKILSIYLILLFSVFNPTFLFAYAVPAIDPIIAADDYFAIRPNLKVIQGGSIKSTTTPNPNAPAIIATPLSATPALAGLVAGAAGIAGLAYYERTGQDPVYAAASAISTVAASSADQIFIPAWQAFQANFVSDASFPYAGIQYVGEEASIGASINDIVNFVKNAADGVCDTLKAMIAAHTATPSWSLMDGHNTVCSSQYASYCDNGKVAHYTLVSAMERGQNYNKAYTDYIRSTWYNSQWSNANQFVEVTDVYQNTIGQWVFAERVYSVTYITGVPDPLPGNDVIDYPGLKNDIVPWLATNPSEIYKVFEGLSPNQIGVSSNPAPVNITEAAPQPAINQQQVNNFFTNNAQKVYNQNVAIQNNPQSTPSELAAGNAAAANAGMAANIAISQNNTKNIQVLDKNQQQQTPETFGAISTNPFSVPITTDPFNIPARFTTFIGRVKDSPICKFSQDFFKSIPGGGSPVYEIEAGQFGHHVIDLSQTLASGLAVLKTILLLCFGFLSIRAVIMKR